MQPGHRDGEERVMYKLWIGLGAVCALGVNAAFGDENSGLYAGVGWGAFSAEIDDVENVDIDFDEDEDALKVFGGWRFNRFFAAELGYIDFGDPSGGIPLLEVSTTGLTPSLVGTLPLGPIELFASAGLLLYDVEVRFNNSDVFDESDDGTIYGAGIGLKIVRLALRLEYQEIEMDEFDSSDAVWITAAWRF
jgi:OOP family OmpA-OmpF porin